MFWLPPPTHTVLCWKWEHPAWVRQSQHNHDKRLRVPSRGMNVRTWRISLFFLLCAAIRRSPINVCLFLCTVVFSLLMLSSGGERCDAGGRAQGKSRYSNGQSVGTQCVMLFLFLPHPRSPPRLSLYCFFFRLVLVIVCLFPVVQNSRLYGYVPFLLLFCGERARGEWESVADGRGNIP